MKTKKYFIIVTMLISAFFAFADELPFVTFSLGLSTGHIFYGDSSIDLPVNKDDSNTISEPEDKKNESSDGKSEEKNEDSAQAPAQTESPTEPEQSSNQQNALDQNRASENDKPSPAQPDSDERKTQSIPLRLEDGNEVLIGVTGGMNFNFTKKFSLFADADVMANFNWQGKNYIHHLDYSFAAGVKFSFFETIPGLTVSLGYLLGDRIDFYKKEGTELLVNATPWGNGLKASIEYSFYRETQIYFAPTIGCSWRYIPRGNNACDHIIQSYVMINF